MNEQIRSGSRVWRYGPLIAWMILIFVASTGELSASNTSRIVRPLLLWLFPDITEARIALAHFWVRKTAHFVEYAIFALLAARAFFNSSHAVLRRGFFFFTLVLVVLYSLFDELHQSYVVSRTGSIYDSFIDILGGLTALLVYTFVRRKEIRTSDDRVNTRISARES